MRTAVFSDMHGNAVALEAVLADSVRQSVDQYVCLGDAVQGGPQPTEIVAHLRTLGCPVVMGNADAWLLSGQETGAEQIDDERRQRMQAIRDWSLARLSAADQTFIAGFASTIELSLGGGHSLLGFHGSPYSFDDVILPDTPDHEIRRLLGGFGTQILAGGHTHIQQIRQLGPSF